MKIKRFVAPDMRQAIRRVREEQGPDAVILANRKVPEGVEIISALDYDEEALYRESEQTEQVAQRPQRQSVQEPRRQAPPPPPPREERAERLASFDDLARRFAEAEADDEDDFDDDFTGYAPRSAPQAHQAPQAPRGPAPDADFQREREARAQSREPQPRRAESEPRVQPDALYERAAIEPEELDELNADYPRGPAMQAGEGVELRSSANDVAQSHALQDMQRELQTLRGLMENQLSVMEWNGASRRQPLRVALLSRFDRMDFGTDVAEAIAAEIGEQLDIERAWRQALALLAKRIPVADDDFLNEGGVIAVVGPTGVGKTTTVAKLAARFAMRHGARNVALVTTDNYRIGAQEQLLHYARILGVPLKTAADSNELAKILSAYYDKKLVLIDTAGMSQRDLRLSEQFTTLRESSPLVKPYLVLSANAQLATLDETVRAFNRVDLAGAIITKLDEAATIGGVLTAAIRHSLPVACVGVGQRVPEDLQPARAHRLVSRAVPESGWEETPIDPEALAIKFGGNPAHAHG